jgi:hypothetical protein
MNMNINLHIERLILDGLPVTGAQGALVQAAVEFELTRLLAEGSLNHLRSATLGHSLAPGIQVAQSANPTRLGQQIARAVHTSVVSPKQPGPS